MRSLAHTPTASTRISSSSAPRTGTSTSALEVSATPKKEQWGHREPVASVVAGPWRAAADGALRQVVINRAVRTREDVDQALADLGDEQGTRRRIHGETSRAARSSAKAAWTSGGSSAIESSMSPPTVSTTYTRYRPALVVVTSRGSSSGEGSPVASSAASRMVRR